MDAADQAILNIKVQQCLSLQDRVRGGDPQLARLRAQLLLPNPDVFNFGLMGSFGDQDILNTINSFFKSDLDTLSLPNEKIVIVTNFKE